MPVPHDLYVLSGYRKGNRIKEKIKVIIDMEI
jgi:hypothetical protein